MATVPRRVATDAERALVAALARCSFPVGSSPKRFAREVSSQVNHLGEITEAQAAYLRRLVTTYRRQIRAESIPEAERGLLTDTAARATREALHATRWTAAPGATVPSWVVRLTGKGTVEAIIAKWGPGATFERRDVAAARAERAQEERRPEPPPSQATPPVDADQLGLFGEGA